MMTLFGDLAIMYLHIVTMVIDDLILFVVALTS
jgi:hypothetical protein